MFVVLQRLLEQIHLDYDEIDYDYLLIEEVIVEDYFEANKEKN
jgi:hypothetical protein